MARNPVNVVPQAARNAWRMMTVVLHWQMAPDASPWRVGNRGQARCPWQQQS